ncbi:hypothetical protein [Rivihabitans pingtungensis]|uniref:hypothetical protein n=1 Tax=Rivihabitans pingtungensis TaxID=1054498 RepID=UPI0011B78CEC|nr:hypothetical protein [Rivihabitans pingtungensis]
MSTYEARLHSESVNKWSSIIADRFDVENFGGTPTECMENVLSQLEERIANQVSADDLRAFVRETYKVGAKRGAAEMLKDLMWYDVLPDNLEDLKKKLNQPLSNSDALSWSMSLQHKKHNGESESIFKASIRITYKSIIEKLEKSLEDMYSRSESGSR